MFNSLITFLRRLDPASEYGVELDPVFGEFSWRQQIDEHLQGPENGCFLVTACYGHVVIAAYGQKRLADEHLAWSRRQSRTLARIFSHNGWRLLLGLSRWRSRLSRQGDVLIG